MRLSPVCLALAATLALGGCSGDDGHDTHPTGRQTGTPTADPTESVPVLQPGRPGETNSTRSAGESATKEPTHPADLRFMRHMQVHHAQALTMVKIVDGRLTDPKVRAMAGRIEAEQKPEMGYMSRWVSSHSGRSGASSTDATGHGDHDPGGEHQGEETTEPDHSSMPGMATAAQLARLKKTSGADTDRLFLQLMIRHHGGAITMVRDRVKGGGTDPDVERFGGDIRSGQGSQIRHMQSMLRRLGGAMPSNS